MIVRRPRCSRRWVEEYRVRVTLTSCGPLLDVMTHRAQRPQYSEARARKLDLSGIGHPLMMNPRRVYRRSNSLIEQRDAEYDVEHRVRDRATTRRTRHQTQLAVAGDDYG